MLAKAILVHGVIGYKFCWLLPEDHNQGTPTGHESNGTIVGDHWEDMNQLIHQLGMNQMALWKFHRPCEIHGSFYLGCEISHTLWTNFAHPVKIKHHTNSFRTLYEIFVEHAKNLAHLTPFRMLCKNLRGLWSNFAPPMPFRTLCENQKGAVRK